MSRRLPQWRERQLVNTVGLAGGARPFSQPPGVHPARILRPGVGTWAGRWHHPACFLGAAERPIHPSPGLRLHINTTTTRPSTLRIHQASTPSLEPVAFFSSPARAIAPAPPPEPPSSTSRRRHPQHRQLLRPIPVCPSPRRITENPSPSRRRLSIPRSRRPRDAPALRRQR